MKRILMVDDHAVMCEKAVDLLCDQFDVVFAHDATQMRQHLRAPGEPFAVAVMDIELRLPYSGIDLLPELKAAGIPVIIYSGTWSDDDIRACMQIGIAGFVDKVKRGAKLRNAVQAVIDGGQAFPTALPGGVFAAKMAKLPHLTGREQKVLAWIIRHPDQNGPALAAAMHITPDSARNVVRALYAKFGVKPWGPLIAEARKRGYHPPNPIYDQERKTSPQDD